MPTGRSQGSWPGRVEPSNLAHRRMFVGRLLSAVALLSLVAACSAVQSPEATPESAESGASAALPAASTADVPDVSGESAPSAVKDLRDAGFESFTVAGRWSADPIGTVLSQDPAPGTQSDAGDGATVTVSLGVERELKLGVFVGLGTCDLWPQSIPPAACAGGPVLLRP